MNQDQIGAAGDSQRSSDDVLLADIERFEQTFADWEGPPRQVLEAFRAAVDALHGEVLRRLITALGTEPAAMEAMTRAAKDPLIFAVLRHHGLLKPSLQERVEEALESIRPMLASHGGGVDLVAVRPPDTVDVRFHGNCDGCPASAITFMAGVKKAIEERCPEIGNVRQVKGLGGSGGRGPGEIGITSPFAKTGEGEWIEGEWIFAADYDQIPENDVLAKNLAGEPVFLSRAGGAVSCYRNACAHLGLALDGGMIRDGVITCPHHGFEYLLASGECLTAPEVRLRAHAVRVVRGRVEVRLAG